MFGALGRKLKRAKRLYDTQGIEGVIRRLRSGRNYPGYLHTMPEEFMRADMEGRFSYLAESQWNWGGKGETVSGPGSTLEYTKQYRVDLIALIREFGFRSFFDAPCGDFNWMSHVVSELTTIDYTGGDIVKGLVERNREKNPGVRFVRFDIAKD